MRAGFSRATIAAALLAVGYASAPAQTSGISDGTVKIGVLTDMAGVFSDLAGAGAVTAAQMAIDDFVEKEKPSLRSSWCRPIIRTSKTNHCEERHRSFDPDDIDRRAGGFAVIETLPLYR